MTDPRPSTLDRARQPSRRCSRPGRLLPLVAATLLWSAGGAAPGAAQIRASERSVVMQTIDGTEITIEYFRPKARDRSPLFGRDAVVWERIWTPGANWATTIAFEKPIRLEGRELEPGKYSMWMVMSEDEFLPGTLFLHPEPKIFHTAGPDPSEAILTLPVERGEGPFSEMLTWDFEDVRTTGATLALRWGTLRIPFEVAVEPSMRQVAREEEAAPVVGTYEVSWIGDDGEASPPFTLEVTHAEDGTVHGDIEGVEGPEGEWLNGLDLMLLPVGDRAFGVGEAWDGELTEVWPGMVFEFELGDGPSATLQMRDEEDVVRGKGQRIG